MFGHTHDDEFNVVRSNDTKNIGLTYIAGSMTTYTGRNPGFTVTEFDAELMIPLNFKTYFFNISLANNSEPLFEELHDFLKEYNISDLRPDNM